MIIQLKKDISVSEKKLLEDFLEKRGIKRVEVITGSNRYFVCILREEIDIRYIGAFSFVKDVHRVTDTFKLVSRQWKVNPTCIDLGDGVYIREGDFAVMAGPCSIESEEQVKTILEELRRNNIKIMRGGIFKPRSSPYSFQGLGIEGLKIFHHHCKKNDIKIITEVMDTSQIDLMYDYVDIFQVGARNSQNFNLLDALGKTNKPVMIKRGISGSLDELLLSAEYVFKAGNEKIILCERGIRTFETAYRNTFDINAIPLLKAKTHLPVIGDPSHGIGIRKYVPNIALACLAAGADGIILEIHPEPEIAFSDGQQSLNFEEFRNLVNKIRMLEEVIY